MRIRRRLRSSGRKIGRLQKGTKKGTRFRAHVVAEMGMAEQLFAAIAS